MQSVLKNYCYSVGFKLVRQKDSHIFYRHADGRYTTLPHHKGRDLCRPLIRTILTVEEYNELLNMR